MTTDIYIQYIIYTGAAPGFWFEGGTFENNFINEFLSSTVLQWRRQNFGSGGHSTQMHSSKTFEKSRKIYKTFKQNFKNYPKFFKNKI